MQQMMADMRVDCGKGIVEEDDLGGPVVRCSGETDSLTLAARECDSFFADLRPVQPNQRLLAFQVGEDMVTHSSPSGHISTSGRRAHASMISFTRSTSTSSGLLENVMFSLIPGLDPGVLRHCHNIQFGSTCEAGKGTYRN